jgi:hypothetical protein
MLNLVYERANREMYELLQSPDLMATGSDISSIISNDIFPEFLNKIGDIIIRGDLVERNYNFFKMPLSEFGALTEYIAASMTRADDMPVTTTGTRVDDFVVNNPLLKALYAIKLVRANYPLTIQNEKFLEMVDNRNNAGIAMLTGVAMQALYDGIEHDHDSIIPALFGALYAAHVTAPLADTIRQIPEYDAENVESYAKEIVAILRSAIRDLTQFRRPSFNLMNADMGDANNSLCLVCFDNPIVDGKRYTPLDIITSQFDVAPQARATTLGALLGIEVVEMPSMGILENSIARAYGIPNFPGMQTNIMTGTRTYPYPDIKFALCGRGALNVGLKRLQVDSGRSIRGHFDQTWVLKTLQLSYGAGQCIFFTDLVIPPDTQLLATLENKLVNTQDSKKIAVKRTRD